MHFHLPKPLHGWREFAGEVGIIVIGVLIALAAEQAVEEIHDRRVAAAARDNIRSELGENLGRIHNREATERCVESRLDEIAGRLAAAENGSPQPPILWVGRPQVWIMLTQRWIAATGGGRASLLPADDQAGLGSMYAFMENFSQTQDIEAAAWAQLRGMTGLSRITPQQDAVFRQALQSARFAAWRLNVDALQIDQQATQLRIRPLTSLHGSQSICIPSSTPFDVALRQSKVDPAFGEPR